MGVILSLLQFRLSSDVFAKVKFEMQASESSGVVLASEAVTHFMELNTEQTG